MGQEGRKDQEIIGWQAGILGWWDWESLKSLGAFHSSCSGSMLDVHDVTWAGEHLELH